jgi:dTMP kinase
MKNKYFVFEGIDGCGKSTLMHMLAKELKVNHETIPVTVKEPGNPMSKVCASIREMVVNDVHKEDMDRTTISFLFQADTRHSMLHVVKPALDQGKIVLQDRCVLSEYAYGNRDGEKMANFNLPLFLSLNPILFFVDIDPKTAVGRMVARGKLNPFERRHVIENIEKINKRYHSIALSKMRRKDPVVHLDNNSRVDIAAKKMIEAFNVFMGEK